MEKRYQVFVSSTFRDLQEERRGVISLIQATNNIPAGMELFPSSDDTAWKVIERVIETSDYYVLIIGGIYGSTKEDGISYTEHEYELAVEKKIPVLAFLHGKPEEIPSGKTEMEAKARKKLETFRKRVEQNHHRATWTSPSELRERVAVALMTEIANKPRYGWVRGDLAENTVRLLQRINDLEEEKAQLEESLANAGAERDLDRFCQGSDDVQLTIRHANGGESIRSCKWHEVFDALAPHLLVGAAVSKVAQLLGKYLDLETRTGISKSSIEAIRSQLLALDLIDVFANKRLTSDGRGNSYEVANEAWALTSRGKRLFAESTAVRREIDK